MLRSFLQSHRGSAVLVALIVLILVSMMTTVFLERIWTFSQVSKGIETSNMAYYNSLGVIEEQLIYTWVTKYQPWNIQNIVDTWGTSTGRRLIATTWSQLIPNVGEGNSSFDTDYNIITLGSPIQLVIPNWLNWNTVIFEFRIPTINSIPWTINPTYSNTGYILWTIGYTWASLFASWETNIFRGSDLGFPTTLWAFNGISNTWSYLTVNTFYNDATNEFLWPSWTKCTGFTCTLKLSLIRPIPLTDGRSIPFLEYKIDFQAGNTVPSQYMILEADSYAYGFFRSRTVRIPQITTNTALDFAILQ